MRSDSTMRQPYGPGWEDPDWTPHGDVPDESWGMRTAEPAARPVVRTLAAFMVEARRHGTPTPPPRMRVARPPLPTSSPFSGQTRRWVMAGSAGLIALAALPPARTGLDDPVDDATQVSAEDSRGPGTPRPPAET